MDRLIYSFLFSTVSLGLICLSWLLGGYSIWLLWPAASFAFVALAYSRRRADWIGKDQQGNFELLYRLFLTPYFLYSWFVWRVYVIFQKEPIYHRLLEDVYIGRRLLHREAPEPYACVFDLTCEFSGPTTDTRDYHCLPILDASVPKVNQLRSLIESIVNTSGPVYIHCAYGHGRTGIVAAAILLHLGHSDSVSEAVETVQQIRPSVRVRPWQLRVLKKTYEVAV